jgi:hypothetical protein
MEFEITPRYSKTPSGTLNVIFVTYVRQTTIFEGYWVLDL